MSPGAGEPAASHLAIRWSAAIFVGLFVGGFVGFLAVVGVGVTTENLALALVAGGVAAAALGVLVGRLIVKRLRGTDAWDAGPGGTVPVAMDETEGPAALQNPYAPPRRDAPLRAAIADATPLELSFPWPSADETMAEHTTMGAQPWRLVFTKDTLFVGRACAESAARYDRASFARCWVVRAYTRGRALLGRIELARTVMMLTPPATEHLREWLGPALRDLLPGSLRPFSLLSIGLGFFNVAFPWLDTGSGDAAHYALAGAALAAGGLVARTVPTVWAWVLQAIGWLGIAMATGWSCYVGSLPIWALVFGVFPLLFALRDAALVGFFRSST